MSVIKRSRVFFSLNKSDFTLIYIYLICGLLNNKHTLFGKLSSTIVFGETFKIRVEEVVTFKKKQFKRLGKK